MIPFLLIVQLVCSFVILGCGVAAILAIRCYRRDVERIERLGRFPRAKKGEDLEGEPTS